MSSAFRTIFVPASSMPALEIPGIALDGGSANPVWVDVPVHSGQPSILGSTMRLPFDPRTAPAIQQWARISARNTRAVGPAVVILVVVAIGATFVGLIANTAWYLLPQILLLLAAGAVWFASERQERKLRPKTYPSRARGGVLIVHVPTQVASEWARLNPQLVVR